MDSKSYRIHVFLAVSMFHQWVSLRALLLSILAIASEMTSPRVQLKYSCFPMINLGSCSDWHHVVIIGHSYLFLKRLDVFINYKGRRGLCLNFLFQGKNGGIDRIFTPSRFEDGFPCRMQLIKPLGSYLCHNIETS